MTDHPRLIEFAFPLKQASIDSVHEKNVRHGHISTLHIWPARRPLAACRAALIATLLPDPGNVEARRELCERIGGTLTRRGRKKATEGGPEERVVEETAGGILHWGRESENQAEIEWFRREIRKAYGGRAPRVLDPFAGGGAIPLEAMRLGCEVTAIDINPVAWFILKCTLEYPQKLAGQSRPLPEFALADQDFMQALGARGKKNAPTRAAGLWAEDDHEADLAWHVRAWGQWVLVRARQDLAQYYPVFADFQPLAGLDDWRARHPGEARPMREAPPRADGTPDIGALNRQYAEAHSRNASDKTWLGDPTCPRWVMKPTVAYLWARTVRCKNCRATIPLLKTRWLAKKERKRVLLLVEPSDDRSGVVFDVQGDVPQAGGNNAQKREHDRRIGQGTMSRAGAWCPSCGKPGTVAMTMQDIRAEGVAGRLGALMTAVVVDGPRGKEYRLPAPRELDVATPGEEELERVFADVPFGIPDEPTPKGGGTGAGRAFSVQGYGMMLWRDLFTPRQLLSLGTFVKWTRAAREAMAEAGYPPEWVEAVGAYLYCALARLADRNSGLCVWQSNADKIGHTFARFALPITWDFVELMPWADASGGYGQAVNWVALVAAHCNQASDGAAESHAILSSACVNQEAGQFDIVVTDPPYYDAIPYSDLMDFFYLWLRRTIGDTSSSGGQFSTPLAPKWDHESNDGELIDDSSRHGGDAERSKQAYEDGMARAFEACAAALRPEGRMVVVFANKQPEAWETLASAIIRSGFVVDGSWPIKTERPARVRSLSSSALASSVWLVCKKRPPSARPGWDNVVLADMRSEIFEQLREFWDAGIRGPDFVWAATGPAMEAYSRHPIVKKADTPGELMGVPEFLRAVRRIVVDFVVGRVLSGAADDVQPQGAAGETVGLDDITTYYLLHRHDFGVDDAPAGACILYAVSCNLSERELADRHDILVRTGGRDADETAESDEADVDAEPDDAGGTGKGAGKGTGSRFRLKSWKQRPRVGVSPTGSSRVRRRSAEVASIAPEAEALPLPVDAIPLIDQVHRLMHLWAAGDIARVTQYIDVRNLRRHGLFHKFLQALVELSPEGSEERRLLEVIMNHFRDLGVTAGGTMVMKFMREEAEEVTAEAD